MSIHEGKSRIVLRMSDYRQLKVWQKAQSVAVKSHQTAQGFRGNENASFRSQIVRAAARADRGSDRSEKDVARSTDLPHVPGQAEKMKMRDVFHLASLIFSLPTRVSPFRFLRS
jgi:hypothetical protein